MSSIHSLLIAGDEISAAQTEPEVNRDDVNTHPESTQQRQDSPPALAMSSIHTFVAAGEGFPTTNGVHEVRRGFAMTSLREPS
jgi:hypothetical protein